MKELSERIRDEAHTPWDILRTWADEVAQLEAELVEHDAYYRKVVDEECAPDEVHCTCVPALRDKIDTLKRENEALMMAEDYYKTGARQTSKRCERPRYVPKRISIPRTVRSDMPGPSVSIHPGEYDAHVNQYGAVSIKIAEDSFLGIMLYEFAVLEWQENPALLTAEE